MFNWLPSEHVDSTVKRLLEERVHLHPDHSNCFYSGSSPMPDDITKDDIFIDDYSGLGVKLRQGLKIYPQAQFVVMVGNGKKGAYDIQENAVQKAKIWERYQINSDIEATQMAAVLRARSPHDINQVDRLRVHTAYRDVKANKFFKALAQAVSRYLRVCDEGCIGKLNSKDRYRWKHSLLTPEETILVVTTESLLKSIFAHMKFIFDRK